MVTGGSGFIGTHIVNELVSKGHEVRIFDRRVPKLRNVEWLDGDLRWLGDCDSAVRGMDAIIHLAARISVDESLDYIWHYFNDNLMATVNLFLAAAKHGTDHILFTSSCEVYGETPRKGATEKALCDPTSPYAASKYAAERAAFTFKKVHPKLKLAVIRPFNTFGEWQRPFRAGAVIPTFILEALRGKPLQIHGKGEQSRDFVYVKDIAKAQVKILEKQLEGIYNIATGQPRTINSVAELIVKLVGKSRVEHVPDTRKGAQLRYSVGDATKLKEATGWKPVNNFEPSLEKVIRWYKSNSKPALRD
ncbi:MAG: NAD-dependent epimerase/dehydratase family protein [Thaumarchaeota archaeon]|nr:NAD-dependent epimerase/dehydratase family protein [Nitrososphaerota archaeon]